MVNESIKPEELIPVKIGDRQVGRGFVDEDGYFHCIIEEEDVREFLNEHHGLTRLSVSDDYAEITLDADDE